MADVFISYSRKDIAFARLIREALQQSEIDTWIDWERIPIGEKWWNEICGAIQAANTFLFVISKNSIGSPVCKDEINLALENHKRIIPIIVDDLQPEDVQKFAPDLPQINWIVFEKDHIFQLAENPTSPSERLEDRQVALPKLPQFGEALEKLRKAIHTDWDWVKAHTNLQVDALRWSENQCSASYLLRGEELKYVENLVLRAGGKDPQPTTLQAEFISASRQEETRKQEEILHIQQESLAAEQKASQRQRMVIWAVGFGLLVAVVLGMVAWSQRNQYLDETHVRATAEEQALTEADSRATAESKAVSQQVTAEAASTQAVLQRDEAQRQTKFALAAKLSAQSQLVSNDQLDLGLLLSVEASKTADTLEAWLSPRLALETSPRLHRMLMNEQSGSRPFAISPDGQTIALVECLNFDTTKVPNVCIQSRVVFHDANSGLQTSTPLDLGAFSAGYLIYNVLDGGKTIILVGNTSVAIWDIQAGRLVGEYPTDQKAIGFLSKAAALSPNGKLLAFVSCIEQSEGTNANGSCNPGGILLWDIEARQLYGKPIAASEENVYALAFSPDSQVLASAGDRTIKLWAVPEPDEVGEAKLIGNPIESADIVTSTLAFSPDGLLASGGSEHNITLWNTASPETPVAQLMGHSYWVSALQFSPDGKTLVSGSWDDSLLLWDMTSRQAISKPLTGHTDDILSLSFRPDGAGLVSTDRQGNLILWDTSNQYAGSPLGRVIGADQGTFVWTHAFSPDGNTLAYSVDRTIYLWDMQKNQSMGRPLTGHQDDIRSLIFPPEDQGRILVSASRDHTTITWDVTTGKSIRQTGQDLVTSIFDAAYSQDGSRLVFNSNQGLVLLSLPDGETRMKLSIPSKGKHAYQLAVNQDASLVAATVCDTLTLDQACSDWAIQIWDPVTDSSAGFAIRGLLQRPSAIAFSPDGLTLAYSMDQEGRIFILDRLTGKIVREIHTPPAKPGRVPKVTNLVFSPNGKQIAASYLFESMLVLWDTQSGRMIGSPFLDQYNIGKPAFSPDEKIIAWPLGDAPFLWDIAGQQPIGQPLQKGDAGGRLVYSQDGQRIAMSGVMNVGDRRSQVFDAASGTPITEPLGGHITSIDALALDAEGKQLFTLSHEGTLNVWDLANAKVVARPMHGYLGSYAKVDLSPNGETLALVACKVKPASDCLENELWLQDTTTGNLTRQPLEPKGNVSIIRYSHDGRLLAIASGKGVMIWDVFAQMERSPLGEASSEINGLAFSPDDSVLATKADSVEIWDLTTGKLVGEPILDKTTDSKGATLAGTEDWGIAFSPDGRWLATVGNVSGSLLLVDITTGQPFGPLLLDQRSKLMTWMMLSVSFSPDGKRLVSGNNSGTVFLWNIDPVAWRELACATAGRTLTIEEWSIYMPASESYQPTCR